MNTKQYPNKSFSYDKRNSLSKLPAIINDLRSLGYQNKDHIPHDDVVYVIEVSIGADRRTVLKYIRLLLRHDYLKKVDGTQPIYSTKFVQVRTKYTVNTTQYKSVRPIGFRFYMFGPRAPKNQQKQLVPPATPPSERGEGQSQNNMCVLPTPHKNEYESHGWVGVETEKRERVGAHTHISITEL